MAWSTLRSTPPISFVPFLGRPDRRPVVAVLRLDGVIAGSPRFRGALHLAGLAPLIDRAFSMRRLAAEFGPAKTPSKRVSWTSWAG